MRSDIIKYQIEDFSIKGLSFYSVKIDLPKTSLLVVGNDEGFFMCGALDVGIYDTEALKARGVICGKALGVKTIDDLLNAKLVEITEACKKRGVFEGMLVKDALLLIS